MSDSLPPLTGDEARAAVVEARNSVGPSDTATSVNYVAAGYEVARRKLGLPKLGPLEFQGQYQKVLDQDMRAVEEWLAERSKAATCFPVDANLLADLTLHMIREVRSIRALGHTVKDLTPYVAGFMFRDNERGQSEVALVRKKRPSWQAGKLNAIGGHIEQGETPVRAMVREFAEETGYQSPATDWRLFCTLSHPSRGGLVHFYTAPWDEGIGKLASTTDEKIEWHPVSLIPGYTEHAMMANLKWLIPLALSPSREVAVVQDDSTN